MRKTSLKQKTQLKAYTPLKAHKGLNKISPKQQERNTKWREITLQKAKDLNYICQWCGKLIRADPFNSLNGHHIIKRRYRIDTCENCYVCHTLCHRVIEDNSVDVKGFPNQMAWENRNHKQQGA